jgi:sarcosine oxidase, subunit beta
MNMPYKAKVVIIGGGINGAAIAFFLAKHGVRDIVVLEADTVAHGASSRGAGIIRTYYQHDGEARLAQISLACFQNWASEIGGECGYRATGFLWLAGPADAEVLKENVARHRRMGAETEYLPAPAIAELQQHLSTEGIAGAAYEPQAGYGNPRQATLALKAAAERNGARFFEHVAVTRLVERSGRIVGVSSTAGEIVSPVVVLAAGAWSAPLAASVGLELPVFSVRMTTGIIRHEPFVSAAMTWIDSVSDTFYRPTGTPGLAHISVRDQRHNSQISTKGFDFAEHVDRQAEIEGIERLRRRIPGLLATPARVWAAFDGVTPDKRGIYGESGIDGLFLCVGGNYKGFKIAPAVGRVMADLVIGGSTDLVDLSPFALSRFAGLSAPVALTSYTLADVS